MDRASWLIPAVVAAAVTLLTTFLTTTAQWMHESTANDREVKRIDREDRREIAKIRADILKAANDSKSLGMVAILFERVLKPIDTSPDLTAFAKQVEEYIGTTAVQVPKGEIRQDLQQLVPPASGSVVELIDKLEGAERLAASNALIQIAHAERTTVITTLIGKLRKSGSPGAYRLNLYIAFTLARLPGGWSAAPDLTARVRQLTKSAEYRDPTFRARVDDALNANQMGA